MELGSEEAGITLDTVAIQQVKIDVRALGFPLRGVKRK